MILEKLNLRAIAVVIIAVLIIIAAGVYLVSNDDSKDKEAPKIEDVTGDTSAEQGESVSISVTFSDNENVTTATIYYKTANSEKWTNSSIIGGSFDLYIPKNSPENFYYYIVIDDEAGNGPIGDPSTDGSTYYTIEVTDEFENGDDEEFIHTVFVEESTATDCRYCPYAADKLHELYESGEYRFYYVSLVEDVNDLARQRVVDEYNRLGNPTVFIDGGYKIINGGLNPLSDYISAIGSAESRDVPKIKLNVTASYDNTTNKILTNVTIKNFEENTYEGLLRVYLTEKISRWNDYNGSKYRFGFLDYIIDNDVSINEKTSKDFPGAYDATDLDPENLMIIAVIFNSESIQAYSNPPDVDPSDVTPFDAHYADACDGTEVIEGGNLPPEVGITFPQPNQFYIRGRPLFSSLTYSKTRIFGKTTITAYAEDDQSIELVEFYINDELVFNDTEEPYEYTPQKIFLKQPILFPKSYVIMVKAIDSEGKSSTASMEVTAWHVF